MITQSPCEPLVFLLQDYATNSSVFPKQFWTADGTTSFNNRRGLADDQLLQILWQTDGGVPRVHCLFLTYSFSSTLIWDVHWSRQQVLVTPPGAQQAPQPPCPLPSAGGAPGMPTSAWLHLARHPTWPSPVRRKSQAYRYQLDSLQFIFVTHFKALDMHSFPQHCCRVGTIPA